MLLKQVRRLLILAFFFLSFAVFAQAACDPATEWCEPGAGDNFPFCSSDDNPRCLAPLHGSVNPQTRGGPLGITATTTVVSHSTRAKKMGLGSIFVNNPSQIDPLVNLDIDGTIRLRGNSGLPIN